MNGMGSAEDVQLSIAFEKDTIKKNRLNYCLRTGEKRPPMTQRKGYKNKHNYINFLTVT